MSEPEKTKWNLPWAKPDEADELEPPPAPFVSAEPLQPKAEPEKPKAHAKSTAKVKHPVHPSHPAHPAHASHSAHPAKHEPKTATVKIESVFLHPTTREVSVHGTVEGKAAAARFHEADLLGLEDVKARQRYVAGHLKSVAETEPPAPPEHLDILGKVEV